MMVKPLRYVVERPSSGHTDPEPLAGATVLISVDKAGKELFWEGESGKDGVAVDEYGELPHVECLGTYHVWVTKSGYFFANPDTVTVIDEGFDRVAAAEEVYAKDPKWAYVSDAVGYEPGTMTISTLWNPEDLARCANALERIAKAQESIAMSTQGIVRVLEKKEERRERQLKKRASIINGK